MAEPNEETQGTPEPEVSEEDAETLQYLHERAERQGWEPGDAFQPAMPPQQEPAEGEGEGEPSTEPSPPGGDAAPAEAGVEAAAEGEDEGQPTGQPDGHGETGTSPGDARGELPKGVKKRIDRMRRQTDRAIAAKDQEIAQLRQQLSGQQATPPAEGEQATPPAEGTAEPPEGDDDPGAYPAREDYATEEAWFADTEDWYEGKKPTRAKKAEAAPAPADTTPPAPEPQPGPQQQQQAAQQWWGERFEDLEESIDEWTEAPENLHEDFMAAVQRGRIKMSPTMMEFMASDDVGAQIAAKFVESPREARRIERKPPAQQVEAMRKLLGGAGDKPAAPATPESSPLPEIPRLSGQGSPREKTLDEAENFEEYSRIRAGMGSRDSFGLPV